MRIRLASLAILATSCASFLGCGDDTETVPVSCEEDAQAFADKNTECGLDIESRWSPDELATCGAVIASETSCFRGCAEAATCTEIVEGLSSYEDCLEDCTPEQEPTCEDGKATFEAEYAECMLDAGLDGLTCPEDEDRALCMAECAQNATCEEKVCTITPSECVGDEPLTECFNACPPP